MQSTSAPKSIVIFCYRVHLTTNRIQSNRILLQYTPVEYMGVLPSTDEVPVLGRAFPKPKGPDHFIHTGMFGALLVDKMPWLYVDWHCLANALSYDSFISAAYSLLSKKILDQPFKDTTLWKQCFRSLQHIFPKRQVSMVKNKTLNCSWAALNAVIMFTYICVWCVRICSVMGL